VLQAEGGLMSITGSDDGPPYRLGVAIADIVTGMFAAQGVTLALLARERTGRGQKVDVGMLDSVAALLTYQAGIYFATGSAPRRLGNRHPTIMPYETFEAADGTFVIAVGNDQQWRRFCELADLPQLADDPRYATNRERVRAYDELRPILAEVLKKRPAAYWIERLQQFEIPCGLVRALDQVLTDPQLIARDMVAPLEHPVAGPIKALGVPMKLSDTPGTVRTPPPVLGEHTSSILQQLGMSEQEISRLKQDKVI
jgi:formyl-CoA transferase/CoA:oxalate CoA-transferase